MTELPAGARQLLKQTVRQFHDVANAADGDRDEYDDAASFIERALAAHPPSLPDEAWMHSPAFPPEPTRLVPVEPTEAMLDLAFDVFWAAYVADQQHPGHGLVPDPQDNMRAGIRAVVAMLAAAPAVGGGVRVRELDHALNVRNLFINPDVMELAADEIDCGPECDHAVETECRRSRDGWCPNDVAETLRELAKEARARSALEG